MIRAVAKAPHVTAALARLVVQHPALAVWIVYGIYEEHLNNNLDALSRFLQHIDDPQLRYSTQTLVEDIRAYRHVFNPMYHAAHQYVRTHLEDAYMRATSAEKRLRAVVQAIGSDTFVQGFRYAVSEAISAISAHHAMFSLVNHSWPPLSSYTPQRYHTYP